VYWALNVGRPDPSGRLTSISVSSLRMCRAG
jgi:hypothetical protein